MTLFIEYPKCTTCKKAKAWLVENNIEFTSRNIVTENPKEEEIKLWYEKSGMALKKFFNTSGNIYKNLSLKDKLPQMSEVEQIKLLASDGMLVKRPLIISDEIILTGFKESLWKNLK